MIRSGKFTDKKILLIDKDPKQKNDRTWSFWETEPGLFEDIVYRRWKKTWFHNKDFSRLLDLDPYEYKMVRGIDFYQYCFSIIREHPGFEVKLEEITSIVNDSDQAVVHTPGGAYRADFVFNSLLSGKPELKKGEYFLLQHFKGWIIETTEPVFNPEEATLMDFRVDQSRGTTFVYVKPFSARKALVEYTLFTASQLSSGEYDEGLKDYIRQFLGLNAYHISETETGIIPMTNHAFTPVNGRIINIGTAGGQTKGSSGYTFRFIQKHSARIVESLVKKGNPFILRPQGPRRFRFYDSTLLHILQYNKVPGDRVFGLLFRKNKPAPVLRFLDNESSLLSELRIISTLPFWPFLKAAVKSRK